MPYHRLGGFNNKHYLLSVLRAGSLRSGVASLLDLGIAAHLLPLHGGPSGPVTTPWVSFVSKSPILRKTIVRSLMVSSNLITSLKALFPNIVTV